MTKETILSVEDDPDIAGMLELYFKTIGYDFVNTPTGKEGVQQIAASNPSLILLDVMLPDMDGYNVIKLLRENERSRHIPVIFLTQKTAQQDKITGLSLGAVDYVTKPFDIDELRLRAERAIQRLRQQNLYNPRTGLPARKLVEEQVRLKSSDKDWALLDCEIKYFQDFVDVYGFVAGDEVLRYLASLIRNIFRGLSITEETTYVGQAEDEEFIIILNDDRFAVEVAKSIHRKFERTIKTHYSFTDQEQGHIMVPTQDNKRERRPFMTVDIGITRPRSQN